VASAAPVLPESSKPVSADDFENAKARIAKLEAILGRQQAHFIVSEKSWTGSLSLSADRRRSIL
jgi:hypothetical protein